MAGFIWANAISTTKGPGSFVVVFALTGRALRERGVLFGLCTGRDAHATEAMYELWGIEGLADVPVGCGGARGDAAGHRAGVDVCR